MRTCFLIVWAIRNYSCACLFCSRMIALRLREDLFNATLGRKHVCLELSFYSTSPWETQQCSNLYICDIFLITNTQKVNDVRINRQYMLLFMMKQRLLVMLPQSLSWRYLFIMGMNTTFIEINVVQPRAYFVESFSKHYPLKVVLKTSWGTVTFFSLGQSFVMIYKLIFAFTSY